MAEFKRRNLRNKIDFTQRCMLLMSFGFDVATDSVAATTVLIKVIISEIIYYLQTVQIKQSAFHFQSNFHTMYKTST